MCGVPQALCELLTTSGKNLDNRTKEKKKIDGYFTALEKWLRSPALAARIRFLIRDVIELRRSQWVPRREALQVGVATRTSQEAHLWIALQAWLRVAKSGLSFSAEMASRVVYVVLKLPRSSA